MSTGRTVADDVQPRLPRGVRLRHDKARGAWVLLGPERLLMPDEPAVEILRLCNGERSVATIAEELARTFDAPPDEIRADVEAFLIDLENQRMIEL
jgi:pyrroloquinoline quinone biosynthesis protein D